MATTTWALANVDYDVSDGFCHTAHWTVTKVDGDYSSNRYGSTGLNRPSSLTARTDLKTADIIADVKAILGTDKVTAIETNLTDEITRLKTPVQGSFVPAN